MAANEFEKSVRRVMDEFKLHPSDEVWQNVEERIRERNRKRRILFFLFCFLGLIMAGSGLYIFSNSRGADSNHKSDNSKQQQVPVSTGNSPIKSDTKTTFPQETAIGQQLVHAETVDRKNSTKKSATRNRNNKTDGNDMLKKGKLEATNSLSANKKQDERSVIVDTARQKPNDVSIDNTKIFNDTENQKVVATELQKDVKANIPADTTLMKNKEGKLSEPATQANPRKMDDQKSMKLKWGVNFSAGASSLRENRLSLGNSSQDKSYSATPPGNVVGGPAAMTFSTEKKPGFAFKMGVIIEKNFSLRSSLSSGLNYVYFSDKIKVGVRQNGTLPLAGAYNVVSYYAGSPQKDFGEHFHFLELPILYGWKITRNANHFLSLDAGISLAYLISTNALIYDSTAGGIYYHNSDLVTKTHFNIIPGISYHVINSKGLEFVLGPQFSFDMTKAIKTDLDKRNYFLYAGIRASLFFEKKKK
jgi:hypothetical protein